MPKKPIPPQLGVRFAVQDARAAGVTPRRLRGGDLDRPFHGVRALSAAPFEPPAGSDQDRLGQRLGPLERRHLQRAREFATRVGRHEFFSHVTAAVIWGLPLPAGVLRALEIDVAVLGPSRHPRGAGVRGHQMLARQTTLRREPRTGLLVTDPATTWATLGAVLHNRRDLVAVADAVVRDWRADPLATLAQLEDSIARGRRVGIRNLREAIPHVRTRAASRPETWARLALVEAGLPEPQLNYPILEGSRQLACVDLAYPHLRIAGEYEGEHHLLDPEQWARDIGRYEQLAAAGWTVVRITKAELFTRPDVFVRRVRAAIAGRS